jgi:hypothetical protein
MPRKAIAFGVSADAALAAGAAARAAVSIGGAFPWPLSLDAVDPDARCSAWLAPLGAANPLATVCTARFCVAGFCVAGFCVAGFCVAKFCIAGLCTGWLCVATVCAAAVCAAAVSLAGADACGCTRGGEAVSSGTTALAGSATAGLPSAAPSAVSVAGRAVVLPGAAEADATLTAAGCRDAPGAIAAVVMGWVAGASFPDGRSTRATAAGTASTAGKADDGAAFRGKPGAGSAWSPPDCGLPVAPMRGLAVSPSDGGATTPRNTVPTLWACATRTTPISGAALGGDALGKGLAPRAAPSVGLSVRRSVGPSAAAVGMAGVATAAGSGGAAILVSK